MQWQDRGVPPVGNPSRLKINLKIKIPQLIIGCNKSSKAASFGRIAPVGLSKLTKVFNKCDCDHGLLHVSKQASLRFFWNIWWAFHDRCGEKWKLLKLHIFLSPLPPPNPNFIHRCSAGQGPFYPLILSFLCEMKICSIDNIKRKSVLGKNICSIDRKFVLMSLMTDEVLLRYRWPTVVRLGTLCTGLIRGCPHNMSAKGDFQTSPFTPCQQLPDPTPQPWPPLYFVSIYLTPRSH